MIVILSIAQMRRLKLRKGRGLAQGHRVSQEAGAHRSEEVEAPGAEAGRAALSSALASFLPTP